MKKDRLHTCLVLFLGAFALQGQTDSTQILNEVTVVESRLRALQIAQFQHTTDSVERLVSPAVSMAEWLQNTSAVHVRQYAPGSAASFSTRGATSAQSSIVWSGFTLNSAATGVSDLSLIPSELFNPALLLGGSAGYFGSGAIGGVLDLVEPHINHSGWHGNFSQQVASFNTFKTALSASYSGKLFGSKTTVLYENSKNDFSYTNQYKIPQTEETRDHASYKQIHANQLFDYKISRNQKLEAEFWYNNASRETPNSILVNKPAAAILSDNYLRSRLNWQLKTGKNKINVGYAFLYEWQSFEDSTVTDVNGNGLLDTNITASHVVQANHEMQISSILKWQNGLQFRFDDVSGSNRNGKQSTSSAQSGLFFAKNKWAAQAVVRAEFWNEEFLPVSPFASVRFEFLKNIFASIYGGYNYRIPSLNDRFWIPGGNINLQPESGWTGEGALFYEQHSKAESMLVRISGYSSSLNNYIQWIPGAGGIWSPQNVKVVSLSGLDFNAKFSRSINKWHFLVELNASLNNALVKETIVKGDASEGEQLIYQPKYKATTGAILGYSGWNLRGNYRYTSSVSTSYDGSTQNLPDYHLIDISISKSLNIKKVCFTAIAAVNNLTDKSYQTIAFFPMPGRNYNFTLKISI